MANKDYLIPAKKGEIRNPKGKPVGTKNRSTLLKQWIEVSAKFNHPESEEEISGTIEDKIVLALVTKALTGDVQAIKEINDTLYGKVMENSKIEHSGTIAIPITGMKIVKDE